MALVPLFSNRDADRDPDVWTYDAVPPPLRIQVVNIAMGALGQEWDRYNPRGLLSLVAETVSHEHGLECLVPHQKLWAQPYEFLRATNDVSMWLDVVLLLFRVIDNACGKYDAHDRRMRSITISRDEAVAELNERFRRAGFGYRYEAGEIIRTDSELLHNEATRPALALLSDKRFAGPDHEFREAHAAFKAGDFATTAVKALNAFESTLKAICDIRGYAYEPGATAANLLSVLRKNNFMPEFAEKSAEQLLATLKNGLPAVRNNAGGHGAGKDVAVVPQRTAAYALNLAATKIRFLVETLDETEPSKA